LSVFYADSKCYVRIWEGYKIEARTARADTSSHYIDILVYTTLLALACLITFSNLSHSANC